MGVVDMSMPERWGVLQFADERVNETAKMASSGHSLDECLAAMEKACPDARGLAFKCMSCAQAHQHEIAQGCGSFGKSEGDGWGVQF